MTPPEPIARRERGATPPPPQPPQPPPPQPPQPLLQPQPASPAWVWHIDELTSDDERWLRAVSSALAARGVRSVVLSTSAVPASAAPGGAAWECFTLRQGSRLDPRVWAQERVLRARFANAPHFAWGRGALERARRVAGESTPVFLVHRPEDPAAASAHPSTARAYRLPHDPAAAGSPPGAVLPDAVLAPAWPLDRNAERRALRLPRRTTLVLHVAPLDREHGHELVLHALAGLRTRGAAPPTVAFLGTGPEESNLHVLCQDLQVKDHVLWLGFRRDVQPYLQAADALIAPVARDATRGLLLAARAAGLVVLAPPGPAAAVGLRHGIDGLAVANADAHTWAGAIEQACGNVRAGSTWGAAARADALERAAPDDAALEVACAVLAEQLARNGFAAHRAALFLDRDGTLIRNVPYNRDPLAVQLEPRVAPALRHLGNAGFVPVVVSNQSGIARGLCAPEEVEAVNRRLRALLQAAGADVSAVYICPHHPERTGPCECRKPAPGMLLQAQRELGLDLGRSVLVGDSPHDLEAAARAGVRAYGYRNPAAPAGGGTELMNPAGNWLELAWRILQDAANAAP